MNFQIELGHSNYPYPKAGQFSDESTKEDLLKAIALYEMYVDSAHADFQERLRHATDGRNHLAYANITSRAMQLSRRNVELSNACHTLIAKTDELSKKLKRCRKTSLGRLRRLKSSVSTPAPAGHPPQEICK